MEDIMHSIETPAPSADRDSTSQTRRHIGFCSVQVEFEVHARAQIEGLFYGCRRNLPRIALFPATSESENQFKSINKKLVSIRYHPPPPPQVDAERARKFKRRIIKGYQVGTRTVISRSRKDELENIALESTRSNRDRRVRPAERDR